MAQEAGAGEVELLPMFQAAPRAFMQCRLAWPVRLRSETERVGRSKAFVKIQEATREIFVLLEGVI